MIGLRSLSFRPISDGIAVCFGNRRKSIVIVVADQVHAGMFWIRYPDGTLSDMVNFARAKDAALTHAANILNNKPPRISPAEAPPVAQIELAATNPAGKAAA